MTNLATEATPSSLFPGPLENKSAEGLADETKTAEQNAGDDIKEPAVADIETPETVTDAPQLVKLELIHHYTFNDEALLPGAELTVDLVTANGLISSTYAKLAV
jgi:hypothetical protein